MSCVHDQRPIRSDHRPVVGVVVSDDDDAVCLGNRCRQIGHGCHGQCFDIEGGHVWIVVFDRSALGGEQMDDVQRRRLAQITDILLVSHTQHEQPASAQRFADIVEPVLDLAHPVDRHFRVDLAGQLDEAGLVL